MPNEITSQLQKQGFRLDRLKYDVAVNFPSGSDISPFKESEMISVQWTDFWTGAAWYCVGSECPENKGQRNATSLKGVFSLLCMENKKELGRREGTRTAPPAPSSLTTVEWQGTRMRRSRIWGLWADKWTLDVLLMEFRAEYHLWRGSILEVLPPSFITLLDIAEKQEIWTIHCYSNT